MNRKVSESDLVDLLIGMVPVPWTKFVLYSECLEGWSSLWFGFTEKETGIVCTSTDFYNRYDSYIDIDTKRNCNHKLFRFIKNYYKADIQKLGPENIWYSFVFVLNEDGTFYVDHYDKPFEGNGFDRDRYVMKKYFGTEYKHINGKYPSKEFLPEEENHIL